MSSFVLSCTHCSHPESATRAPIRGSTGLPCSDCPRGLESVNRGRRAGGRYAQSCLSKLCKRREGEPTGGNARSQSVLHDVVVELSRRLSRRKTTPRTDLGRSRPDATARHVGRALL